MKNGLTLALLLSLSQDTPIELPEAVQATTLTPITIQVVKNYWTIAMNACKKWWNIKTECEQLVRHEQIRTLNKAWETCKDSEDMYGCLNVEIMKEIQENEQKFYKAMWELHGRKA